ncbi:unnamed protein product, partial [Brachionus calyciflorus]
KNFQKKTNLNNSLCDAEPIDTLNQIQLNTIESGTTESPKQALADETIDNSIKPGTNESSESDDFFQKRQNNVH